MREITKGYDTIKVYELNNDIRTASSPRNFALEKAHGRYLFFRVRFDQTKEVIEYHKGDPNIKDILTLTTFTPWTQALRRDLVEDNHIRYNPETVIGEDLEFNVICINCADKIIALPQLIGYVYYINHASTLQSGGPVPHRSQESG